ncbi:hypothetical protein [Nocardia gipuzkoensis]
MAHKVGAGLAMQPRPYLANDALRIRRGDQQQRFDVPPSCPAPTVTAAISAQGERQVQHVRL